MLVAAGFRHFGPSWGALARLTGIPSTTTTTTSGPTTGAFALSSLGTIGTVGTVGSARRPIRRPMARHFASDALDDRRQAGDGRRHGHRSSNFARFRARRRRRSARQLDCLGRADARCVQTGRRLRRCRVWTPVTRSLASFVALALALPGARTTLAALGPIGSPTALVAPRLVGTSLATRFAALLVATFATATGSVASLIVTSAALVSTSFAPSFVA